jgi:hypothetical protein
MNKKKVNRRKSDLKKDVIRKKIVAGLKCAALVLWFLIETTLDLLIFTVGAVRKGVMTMRTYIVERRARKVLSTYDPYTRGQNPRQSMPSVKLEEADWYLDTPDFRLTRIFTIVILLHVIVIAAILAWKLSDVASPISSASVIESAQVDSTTPTNVEQSAPVEIEQLEPKVFYDVSRKEMPLSEVLACLRTPEFYTPYAVSGIRPEVVKAHQLLLDRKKEMGLGDRFTPEELAAIIWRESGAGDRKNPHTAMIQLHLLGDRGLNHKAYGAMQFRFPAWGEVLVDSDGAMPFSKEMRAELRRLGIKNSDFMGNLPFAIAVFEWLHYRYSQGADLYTAAGTYNAGPTGFKNGGGRSYGRWVVAMTKVILAEMPETEAVETQSVAVKGTVAEDEMEGLEEPVVPVVAAKQSWSSRFLGTMKTAWSFASAWFIQGEQDVAQAASVSLDSTKSVSSVRGNTVSTAQPSFTAEYTARWHKYGTITVEGKGGEPQPSLLFPDSVLEGAQEAYAYLDSPTLVTTSPVDQEVAWYGPAQ